MKKLRGWGLPVAEQYSVAFWPSFTVMSWDDVSSRISGGTEMKNTTRNVVAISIQKFRKIFQHKKPTVDVYASDLFFQWRCVDLTPETWIRKKSWKSVTQYKHEMEMRKIYDFMQYKHVTSSVRFTNVVYFQAPNSHLFVRHAVTWVVCDDSTLQCENSLISRSHPSDFIELKIFHVTAENGFTSHGNAHILNWLCECRLRIEVVLC